MCRDGFGKKFAFHCDVSLHKRLPRLRRKHVKIAQQGCSPESVFSRKTCVESDRLRLGCIATHLAATCAATAAALRTQTGGIKMEEHVLRIGQPAQLDTETSWIGEENSR